MPVAFNPSLVPSGPLAPQLPVVPVMPDGALPVAGEALPEGLGPIAVAKSAQPSKEAASQLSQKLGALLAGQPTSGPSSDYGDVDFAVASGPGLKGYFDASALGSDGKAFDLGKAVLALGALTQTLDLHLSQNLHDLLGGNHPGSLSLDRDLMRRLGPLLGGFTQRHGRDWGGLDFQKCDPTMLVMWVLRVSYLQITEDLRYHADKVRYMNELKKVLREELTRARQAGVGLEEGDTLNPPYQPNPPDSYQYGGFGSHPEAGDPPPPTTVQQMIADGQLTVEQAINRGLITHEEAVAQGLTTWEELAAMGLAQKATGAPESHPQTTEASWSEDELDDGWQEFYTSAWNEKSTQMQGWWDSLSDEQKQAMMEKWAAEGLTFTLEVGSDDSSCSATVTITPLPGESPDEFMQRALAEAGNALKDELINNANGDVANLFDGSGSMTFGSDMPTSFAEGEGYVPVAPGGGDQGPAADGLAGQPITTKEELDAYVQALEEKLNGAGDDAQLANVDLQNILQKHQQTLQMISNISKMDHDTALAIIRKIGS